MDGDRATGLAKVGAAAGTERVVGWALAGAAALGGEGRGSWTLAGAAAAAPGEGTAPPEDAAAGTETGAGMGAGTESWVDCAWGSGWGCAWGGCSGAGAGAGACGAGTVRWTAGAAADEITFLLPPECTVCSWPAECTLTACRPELLEEKVGLGGWYREPAEGRVLTLRAWSRDLSLTRPSTTRARARKNMLTIKPHLQSAMSEGGGAER